MLSNIKLKTEQPKPHPIWKNWTKITYFALSCKNNIADYYRDKNKAGEWIRLPGNTGIYNVFFLYQVLWVLSN